MFQKIQQSPWTPWVLGFVIGLLVGLLVGQDQGRDHKGRLGKEMQGNAPRGMMMDHGADKAQGKGQNQDSRGEMMPISERSGHDMSMTSMTDALKGKTGDEFDKAFLMLMVDHHQGAVDMANEVLKNAKHAELKTFAQAIIDAQSKEITTMQQWMKDWGYQTTSVTPAQ
jgi:uncharacterized protein (DUF305 family)